MNGPRFTVARLLGAVALLACLLAMLRDASAFSISIAAIATLLLLLTGVAGACFARGAERAFWAGFALFGMTTLILIEWDWIGAQFGADLSMGINETAQWAYPVPIQVAGAENPRGSSRVALRNASVLRGRDLWISNFIEIGRMILSLICALVGGLVSRRFANHAAASRSES